MLDARFVPLLVWPGKATEYKKRSRFKSKYSSTLDQLTKELKALGARDILVQAFFKNSDIKNDGWPKSVARPSRPGVIVTFLCKDGKTISMPCDCFHAWECNLRAIAKSLEALRMVDRYGVTRNGEQYRGWEQLPPPSSSMNPMSVEEASEVIARESGTNSFDIKFQAALFVKSFPLAIKASHPDKNGSSERFIAVQRARVVLNQLHGTAV